MSKKDQELVMSVSGENIVAMGKTVEERVARLRADVLPPDIALARINDLPVQVDNLVKEVERARFVLLKLLRAMIESTLVAMRDIFFSDYLPMLGFVILLENQHHLVLIVLPVRRV